MSNSVRRDAFNRNCRLGYLSTRIRILGYLAGGADAATVNIVYNLADFVNKIAFGVVIWAAAVKESA